MAAADTDQMIQPKLADIMPDYQILCNPQLADRILHPNE